MKSLSSISLFICLPLISFAQQQPEILKINSQQGNAYLQGYIYKTFLDGKVISKDSTYGKAKLNFNGLTNEMLFIGQKGDTLKLAHPEETMMVTIQTDTFSFFKNTFLKKITHYNNALDLFQRQEIKQIDNEKKSAYGYSSLESNTSSGVYMANGITTYISEDRNFVFKRNREILVSNNRGDFFPVKQATFYKLLPKYKDQLKTFIDTAKTNFNKEEDIMAIAEYAQKLQLSDNGESN